jgi:hypothetical protein
MGDGAHYPVHKMARISALSCMARWRYQAAPVHDVVMNHRNLGVSNAVERISNEFLNIDTNKSIHRQFTLRARRFDLLHWRSQWLEFMPSYPLQVMHCEVPALKNLFVVFCGMIAKLDWNSL